MRNRFAGLAGVALLCLLNTAHATHLGDFAVGTDNICTMFNTYQPSTGASFTIVNEEVDVYKDDNVAQDNDSGLTIDDDFDGVTGVHQVCVDTSSDGTFYSAGSIFTVIVSVGTVDSVSVVGTKVMTFTLAKGVLSAGAITATVLATDAIGAAEVAAGAIAADAFASGAIDATAIAADAIGASEIAANALTTAEIATGAISSDEVADDAIDAGAIATDAIGAAEIAASAITNSELASDGSEFTSVGVASISGDTAAADNLEAVLDLIVNTGNGAFPPFSISASGTAQSYTAGTPDIVLAASTAAADNDFNGQTITAWGDEGELQSACVSDYTGATDTAVLLTAFNTNITGTIRYVIYPTLSCEAASLTAADVRTEMDANSTQLAAIVADTNEVQISLANGGLIESMVDDIGAAGAGLTNIDLPNQTMDITGTLSTVTTATNVTTVNGFANDALVAADIADDVSTEFARKLLDTAVDGALDVEEMLCYLTAVLVNEMDYNGTDEAVFDNAAGDTPKVTITYANGDRTGVTLAACGN